MKSRICGPSFCWRILSARRRIPCSTTAMPKLPALRYWEAWRAADTARAKIDASDREEMLPGRRRSTSAGALRTTDVVTTGIAFFSPLAAAMKSLPEADVILAGETREWESVEYAQDTVAAGRQKGMIMLGRVVSEDPGMNVCAEWLKTFVHEAPVRWLPAGDPYWRPA